MTNTNQINETLIWLRDTASELKDFTAEQAPLYAQEVIAWEFWSNVAGGALFALAAVISSVVARKTWHWREYGGMHPCPCRCAFFAVLMLVLAIPFATLAAKAQLAPRVVLVKHFKGVVR